MWEECTMDPNMHAFVRIPSCLNLVLHNEPDPSGGGNPLEMSARVWSRERLTPGTILHPDEGGLLNARLHFYTILPAHDIRRTFGAYDVIMTESNQHIRHCNWVRFLRHVENVADANVLCSILNNHAFYHVIKDVRPNDELVVKFSDIMQARGSESLPAIMAAAHVALQRSLTRDNGSVSWTGYGPFFYPRPVTADVMGVSAMKARRSLTETAFLPPPTSMTYASGIPDKESARRSPDGRAHTPSKKETVRRFSWDRSAADMAHSPPKQVARNRSPDILPSLTPTKPSSLSVAPSSPDVPQWSSSEPTHGSSSGSSGPVQGLNAEIAQNLSTHVGHQTGDWPMKTSGTQKDTSEISPSESAHISPQLSLQKPTKNGDITTGVEQLSIQETTALLHAHHVKTEDPNQIERGKTSNDDDDDVENDDDEEDDGQLSTVEEEGGCSSPEDDDHDVDGMSDEDEIIVKEEAAADPTDSLHQEAFPPRAHEEQEHAVALNLSTARPEDSELHHQSMESDQSSPRDDRVAPPESLEPEPCPVPRVPPMPQDAPIRQRSSEDPNDKTRGRGRQRKWWHCDVCPKRFDRPSLLKRHTRTHTGEKPHVCEECGKGFSTSSSLNTHKRTHSGERPHACPLCGKTFAASSNLYYHRITHNKVKPHKCKECPRSFPTPGDLRCHMYVHTGLWPFKCEFCSKGFSKQTNLRNHVKHHMRTDRKKNSCPKCGLLFAKNDPNKGTDGVCLACSAGDSNLKAEDQHNNASQQSTLPPASFTPTATSLRSAPTNTTPNTATDFSINRITARSTPTNPGRASPGVFPSPVVPMTSPLVKVTAGAGAGAFPSPLQLPSLSATSPFSHYYDRRMWPPTGMRAILPMTPNAATTSSSLSPSPSSFVNASPTTSSSLLDMIKGMTSFPPYGILPGSPHSLPMSTFMSPELLARGGMMPHAHTQSPFVVTPTGIARDNRTT